MNYSQKGTVKKQNQIKSKKKKLMKKVGVSFFRTFIVCCFIGTTEKHFHPKVNKTSVELCVLCGGLKLIHDAKKHKVNQMYNPNK